MNEANSVTEALCVREGHAKRVQPAHTIEGMEPIAPCAGAVVNGAEEGGGGAWRGELAQRMEAYRVRRRKLARHPNQSQFVFEDAQAENQARVAVAQKNVRIQDEFAFSLAIGPRELGNESQDARMEIDVSIPLNPSAVAAQKHAQQQIGSAEHSGAYSVASLEERRWAGLIDVICLAFAYGGFLALFSSLGGQFTLSKLSTAVYGATIAIVYLQYFALFTIFGGTTPGMMFRGLQVTSFDGDPPSPKQMLLRSVGYMMSGGTFFLGFLWACWDEDGLTWHDRLSRTYLNVPETFANEGREVAPSHGR